MIKKVLTVGVFDFFHYGHLKAFENAKKLNETYYFDNKYKYANQKQSSKNRYEYIEDLLKEKK